MCQLSPLQPLIHSHCSVAFTAGVLITVKLPIELQCINIMQTEWRALIIDPLSMSEGSSCGKLKIMCSIFSNFTEAAPTVFRLLCEKHLSCPKGRFRSQCRPTAKITWKGRGVVGRCLRDNRGLSQSLKEGDNTCRLQSKSPFTVGMESVTKAVMQLSVWMFILLPTLNATLWHLFQPLVEH